jgi:hypothetical protein
MVPSMKFLPFWDNYTRDIILMSREWMLSKNDYIKKQKKMNHAPQRANSILQKPYLHSDMHWFRSPLSGMYMYWLTLWTGAFCFFLQMISRHWVFKCSHSINILTDLESAHQWLSFEVLHNMVLSLQNLTLGYIIFDPVDSHESLARLALKTNQLSGRPCATFTPSLKLIL